MPGNDPLCKKRIKKNVVGVLVGLPRVNFSRKLHWIACTF